MADTAHDNANANATQISQCEDMGDCDALFALYRKDSGTLGFLPRGAFEEGIHQRRVLVAKNAHGKCDGYLLYRIVRRKAVITHLCVAKRARGKGVACDLVNRLKDLTKELDGITLKCRRDFSAHRLWPKLGFAAKTSVLGRGADKAELVVWHLDHGTEDLFSTAPLEKTLVVIDANVFFDLTLPNRPKKHISGALLEPWIDESITLALTPEIYNDIDRAHETATRESSKVQVTAYHLLRTQARDVDALIPRLRATCAPKTEQDESDIRHLAHAIAGRARYFVTRDEGLLAQSIDLLEAYDLHVLSPVELIFRLDWIEREAEYQPRRLAGSNFVEGRVEASQIDEIISSFRICSEERAARFRHLLEQCLANPRQCELKVAREPEGRVVALMAITSLASPTCFQIDLLRTCSHELSATVVRHF